MKCPRCETELIYEPTREVQYERDGGRQHNGLRCADLSAERARRAEAENVKMAGGVGAWVRECSTRLDAEQAAHRATAAKLARVREALRLVDVILRDSTRNLAERCHAAIVAVHNAPAPASREGETSEVPRSAGADAQLTSEQHSTPAGGSEGAGTIPTCDVCGEEFDPMFGRCRNAFHEQNAARGRDPSGGEKYEPADVLNAMRANQHAPNLNAPAQAPDDRNLIHPQIPRDEWSPAIDRGIRLLRARLRTMNAKTVITLIVGILALAVTAWKGPSVWSAISAGAASVCLFVGTLGIVPAKDQEYVQDLENALQQKGATPEAVPAGPSRARLARRLSH